VLEAVRKDLSSSSEVRRLMADRNGEAMAWYSSLFAPNVSISDRFCGIALARELAGTYHEMDTVEFATSKAAMTKIAPITRAMNGAWREFGDTMFEGILSEPVMFVHRQIEHRSKRYDVMNQAPKFYGFSLLLILAGAPIAGLYCLLPGGWKALVNWGKLLVSIKLWPLFWYLLYVYNSLTADFDARIVMTGVYFVVPVVSFMFVQSICAASGGLFSRISQPTPVNVMGSVGQVAGAIK
jgi:hypothetical protein